ncbi:MAG TPA: type II toxin-antitoxin system HicA family toxin [Thermoanaerobaculia bacterium]|nr:type II toxin-antitoxin system HicA family toxin [Thermoanaerobaculia bacterium]
MTQFSAVTGRQLITALGKVGFAVIRVRGSHHFLRHQDGRTTVVPVHSGENIGPGLLGKVLRDTRLTREELQNVL